ncbi:hypothetical protein QBC33DRAFT_549281 [Phialemonium atrogriseum]|uniref:Uncharacterized protein n=1 Tax=Phialemonium atrogriseum TaxID=1093897 RepID=A0AAJ0BSP5_9PEZI|nr:uncharacterized protein QBC33DRAFT_549281 [Phialemonium atrogriseum]KAK1763546.1 hypothetical protein QBC33DRAFT_549281 [Phialemonium atrogriseum]
MISSAKRPLEQSAGDLELPQCKRAAIKSLLNYDPWSPPRSNLSDADIQNNASSPNSVAINAPSNPTTSTHFPIPMPSLDNEGYLPPYESYPEGLWGSDINYAGPSLNRPVPPPPIATSPNVAEQGSDLDNHRADVPDNASPDSDSAGDRNAEDDDWQDDDDYYDEEEEANDDDYDEKKPTTTTATTKKKKKKLTTWPCRQSSAWRTSATRPGQRWATSAPTPSAVESPAPLPSPASPPPPPPQPPPSATTAMMTLTQASPRPYYKKPTYLSRDFAADGRGGAGRGHLPACTAPL